MSGTQRDVNGSYGGLCRPVPGASSTLVSWEPPASCSSTTTVPSRALAHRLVAEPDLEVVGVAATAAEAGALAGSLRPDLAVVDVELGADEGLVLVAHLAALEQGPVVVVVTCHVDVFDRRRRRCAPGRRASWPRTPRSTSSLSPSGLRWWARADFRATCWAASSVCSEETACSREMACSRGAGRKPASAV